MQITICSRCGERNHNGERGAQRANRCRLYSLRIRWRRIGYVRDRECVSALAAAAAGIPWQMNVARNFTSTTILRCFTTDKDRERVENAAVGLHFRDPVLLHCSISVESIEKSYTDEFQVNSECGFLPNWTSDNAWHSNREKEYSLHVAGGVTRESRGSNAMETWALSIPSTPHACALSHVISTNLAFIQNFGGNSAKVMKNYCSTSIQLIGFDFCEFLLYRNVSSLRKQSICNLHMIMSQMGRMFSCEFVVSN